MEEIVGKESGLNLLINNAGILIDKSFSKMEIDDFEKVLNVHLIGSVKPTKAVWEIMKEQNYGRILVTSSSSGLFSVAFVYALQFPTQEGVAAHCSFTGQRSA